MAGQGGLEPPASGFGDRRSTNWSYWPISYELAGLFMNRVTLAPFAVLLELNALRIVLLIFFGGVVTALALGTSQRHQCSHEQSFLTRPYEGKRGTGLLERPVP